MAAPSLPVHRALILASIAAAAAQAHGAPVPDFGPNVTIIDPSMPVRKINATLQALATRSNGFDEVRNAVYFMPGTYGSAAGQDNPAAATGFIDAPVGFMETVQGLGAVPDDVTINGNLRVGAVGRVALDTFWRSLENVRINPIEADEKPHTLRWNTSQACPLRRVDITGNLDLTGGVGGGNLMADSRVSGVVSAGFDWVTDPVQVPGQFYYDFHDSQIGAFQGHWINYVFAGVEGAPQPQFAPGDVTALPATPVVRDAPFLYVEHGAFRVFVPGVGRDVRGIHWRGGRSLALRRFFIAKPEDSAAILNAQLRRGKNVILTPGVYKVTEPIHVVRPDTIILGMGLATVTPITGSAAIQVDDVPGVSISAITVDANITNSGVLVRVGSPGHHHGHRYANPTTLSDVFVRVGGSYVGHATTSFEINQDDVLIDHTWLWRADHGNKGTIGWTANTGDHGLVVNGDRVTVLGLFVEHYQKAQVLWNGNAGRAIFLQSEAPYDAPGQAAYMNGGEDGYPFYQVGGNVTSHEAAGMTVATLFIRSPTPVFIRSAYKAPEVPGVHFQDIFAGVILGKGGVQHVINDTGGSALAGGPPPFANRLGATTQLKSYP